MYQAASVESRRADCARLLAKYPGAVPIALVPAKSTTAKATQLALPRSATVADLLDELNVAAGAIVLVDECTPTPTTVLGDLHDCCEADDGFLHVTVLKEQRMGDAIAVGCCQSRVERDDDPYRTKPVVARSCCCNVAVEN